MLFKLNEAPNDVLAAINSHRATRACGLGWSILCCLPTLGVTVGTWDVDDNTKLSCCFPKPLGIASNANLNVLIETFKAMKLPNNTLYEASPAELKTEQGLREAVQWQVENTINILEHIHSNNSIDGSYREILDDVLTKIKTKAQAEETFGSILEKRPLKLTGYEINVPNYGLSNRR